MSSLLVQDQVLSVTHVEQALQRQVIFGGDLATNLLELGLVDELVLAEYLGRVVRLPVYPAEYLMSVDPRVLKMMPRKVATEHRVVPVKIHGDTMVVAAAGPIPKGALDEVSFLLGLELAPNLVLEFRLAMALNRYYGVPVPARLQTLQRKLAPDFQVDQEPIVPANQEGTSLIKSSESPVVPAAVEPSTPDLEPVPEPETPGHVRPDTTDRMIVVESSSAAEKRDEETLKFITGSQESTNKIVSVMRNSAAAGGSEPPEPEFTSLPAPGLLKHSRALELLEAASGRDDILDVFLRFASQAFEFSVLMVAHGKTAQGRSAVLRGRPAIPAEQVTIPLDEGGMFANVFETKGYHLGPPSGADVETGFFAALGRQAPDSCAILPVVLRGRVILLFYGDSGERGVKANRVARLSDFARSVSSAFEKLLLRQKYGQYDKKSVEVEAPRAKVTPAAVEVPPKVAPRKRDFSSWTAADEAIGAEAWPEPSKPSIPAPAASPTLPAPEPAPVPESQPSAVEKAVVVEAKPEPAPAPKPVERPAVLVMAPTNISQAPAVQSAPAPEPEESFQNVMGSADRVTEPAQPEVLTREERMKRAGFPAPELVKRVETIVVRSSPPVEPAFDTPKRVIDIESGEKILADVDSMVPMGESARAVDPYADSEPPPDPREDQVPTSRSVRVEMPEEVDRLIERVLSRGPFDVAAADLLVGIGDDALDKLMPNFPGPLLYDRYQESSRLRKVGKHGPLLRTLLQFGQTAGRFLLPLMDSYDSEVRFYSVFLFSEIDYPEALTGLVKRLFDNDRQIRALAVDVMRRFSDYPEYRWAAQEVALVLTSSASTLERKRLAAEALGELQDPVAIRPLAEMLGSVDGVLAERCQRALVKITFNDFGFSERRWLAWWQSNRNHHRVEWAMGSINHRGEDIRKSALDELKHMVGDAVEWPRGPLDHRQRREVKRMCLQWWEREGRALNPVFEVD